MQRNAGGKERLSRVHQRSWWVNVIRYIQIANIRLHHLQTLRLPTKQTLALMLKIQENKFLKTQKQFPQHRGRGIENFAAVRIPRKYLRHPYITRAHLSACPKPGQTGWLQEVLSGVCTGWPSAAEVGRNEAISQTSSGPSWAEYPDLLKEWETVSTRILSQLKLCPAQRSLLILQGDCIMSSVFQISLAPVPLVFNEHAKTEILQVLNNCSKYPFN